MNKLYYELVQARAAAAVAEGAALRAVNHAGLKGALRETVVKQLLQPFLPPALGIASGTIVSSRGEQSGQCDLVIYDSSLVPPLLLGEGGIIPLEATLAVVEVKSTLTMEELRTSHEAAKRIQSFEGLSGTFDLANKAQHHYFEWPIGMVFAFATDLSESARSELERYQELLAGGLPALQQICVVGRGSWLFRPSPNADVASALNADGQRVRPVACEWMRWPQPDAFAEVVGFIGALVNSLPGLALRRGQPRMGQYLVD